MNQKFTDILAGRLTHNSLWLINGLLESHMKFGTMVLYGPYRPCEVGTMELWNHETLGTCAFGTMGLWDHETLAQGT